MRRSRVPVAGTACALLGLVGMLAVSLGWWDRIPEAVVTREASARRAATEVPRWVVAAAVPLLHLTVTSLVTTLVTVAGPGERAVAPAARTTGLNVLLVLLSAVFPGVHAVVTALAAGADLPVAPTAVALCGAVLLGVGAAMPAIARRATPSVPAGTTGGPLLEKAVTAWHASHSLGGAVMAGAGFLLVLSAPLYAFLLPDGALAFAIAATTVTAAVLTPFAAMTARTLASTRRGASH
ncbi:hypothetical protein [Nocardiopsis baichengensis]|uniref:hypothetical protein n=1 Tax=Nocardiopsis baichengensis TaxID=280240 RepID=UPI00034B5E26|nr:hypothetical protein [Nocardiopsis baichengensis]